MYVRDNILPPGDFVGSRKRAVLTHLKKQKTRDAAFLEQQKGEYERYCEAQTLRHIAEVVLAADYEALHAIHVRQNRPLFSYKSAAELAELSHITARSEIQNSGRVQLAAFEMVKSSCGNELAPEKI